MKIAIDISQVIYGTGVSKYTKFLLQELIQQNSTNEYVFFGGSLKRKKELDHFVNQFEGVTNKTNYLSPQMAHFLWNTLHVLPAETFTGKVNLIHTSDWAEPPSSLPKVTTVHDLSMFHDPKFSNPKVNQVHRKRLFWVMKESKKIIAVSHTTKNDLIKYLEIDPERIEVIYEAPTIPLVDLNSAEMGLGQLKRLGITKPFILVPGSGNPRKNIKRAIAAFKKVDLDLQLVIVGRPDQDEQALSDAGVLFTDFVSDLDFALLISQAQLLLYPSLYEGFGLPILEAFSAGTPVVTSNLSSMEEIAGGCAVLVDPLAENSLADGIIKALKNRDELVKKGRVHVKRFSWEQTARETLKLYEDVVRNH